MTRGPVYLVEHDDEPFYPNTLAGPVNWGCIAALVLNALLWVGIIWLACNWRPSW